MNAYSLYYLTAGGKPESRIMLGHSWIKAWVSLISAVYIRDHFSTPIALLQVEELAATPSGTQRVFDSPIRHHYIDDNGTFIQQQSKLATLPNPSAA